jgi:hypothetical protein
MLLLGARVARCFFKTKMPIWVNLGRALDWKMWGHFEYFINRILGPFGNSIHLVHYFRFGGLLSRKIWQTCLGQRSTWSQCTTVGTQLAFLRGSIEIVMIHLPTIFRLKPGMTNVPPTEAHYLPPAKVPM